MKKFLLLLLVSLQCHAGDITGFWKRVDEKSGLSQCILAIYPYEGKYYGRIVASYDKKGVIDDSIYHPTARAPGVKGKPYYAEIDIIWNVRPSGSEYKGKILDPQEGDVYDAELWIDKRGNLIVRGKLFIFGRNTLWYPVSEADFTSEFPRPDLATLTPSVPSK